MKRIIAILLSVIICGNLIACSSAPASSIPSTAQASAPVETASVSASVAASATMDATPSATTEATPGPSASAETIDVNKGLFSVEVTIPISMLGEGADIGKTIEEAKKNGVSEVIKNEDSLTYRMSKAVHTKLLADMKASFDKNIKDITTSGEYKSIKKISTNDDFTQVEMVVDKKAYEGSMDSLTVLVLVMSSAYYQSFNGNKDYKMTLTLKDEATGEVIDTIDYPDAFQTSEE